MLGTAQATYVDFSGGVNVDAAPYLLPENQASDARNVRTNRTGRLIKRNGFQTLGSLAVGAERPLSLAAANTATKSLIVGTSGGKLVKMTTGGVASDLKTGLSTTARWDWVQAETSTGSHGPLYGMNGVASQVPQTWDGAAGSTSDWTTNGSIAVPRGKYMTYLARVWVTGVEAFPSRVYFSGFNGTAPDPREWNSDAYVDLDPNDGEAITGIGTYGNYILVFKPRKTFVIYDLVTGANRRISSEIGCIAHRSIVETPSGTFFLSEDVGVASTDGNEISLLSANVDSLLRRGAVQTSTFQHAAATYFDQSYFLSFCLNLSANDITLEYDIETQSWWIHSIGSNDWALLDPAGTPRLYSAQPAAGRIERAFAPNVYQDAGTNYSSYWQGPHFTWGTPHRNKQLNQFRIDGYGSWVLQAATDFTEDFTILDGELWSDLEEDAPIWGDPDETWGDASEIWGETSAQVRQYRYYTPGFGRAWQLKLISTDAVPWEVYALTSAFTERTD
jgi:hypothetical protein